MRWVTKSWKTGDYSWTELCLVVISYRSVPFLLFLLFCCRSDRIDSGRHPFVPGGIILAGPWAETKVKTLQHERGRHSCSAHSERLEGDPFSTLLRGSCNKYICDLFSSAPVHNVFRFNELSVHGAKAELLRHSEREGGYGNKRSRCAPRAFNKNGDLLSLKPDECLLILSAAFRFIFLTDGTYSEKAFSG